MNKIFSTPLFWTNVITAVVMLFLVGTIVFGWTNPTLPPPQGSGAVSIVASGPDAGHVSIGGKRLVNVTTPVNDSDSATKGWVNSLLGQQSGGEDRLLLTLWGRCPTGGGGDNNCTAGEGTPACSSIGSGVNEVYAGFGPFAYADDPEGGWNEPTRIKTADSIPICSNANPVLYDPNSYSVPNPSPPPATLGWLGTGPQIYEYKAAWGWPPLSGYKEANTCRVCLIGGSYVPGGG